MGRREFYETIDSTQDRAIELARDGAPEGTVVVARSQRQGRGRLDHAWWSPSEGGLYLSVILAPPPSPRTLLALAIGVELRTELRERAGLEPVLKWPNDLLMTEGSGPPRKLSGVLIDEVPSPTLGVVEVAGIGINVRSAPPDAPLSLRGRVAAIEDWVRPPPDLASVETWATDAALRAARRLRTPKEALALLAECRRALYGVGRLARVDGVPSGLIESLGDEGELWLLRGAERIAVRTGDVEVAP